MDPLAKGNDHNQTLLELQQLWNDGKILQAKEICDRLDYLRSSCPASNEFWKAQENLITKIKTDFDLVQALLPEFSKSEDWEQGYQGLDYHVHYKQLPNSPFYKMKLEGTINCSLYQFSAVINEVDMYLNWVPFILGVGLKSSIVVARPSRLRVIGHLDIVLPWPLSCRDFAVDGFAVDLLDNNGTVLIVLRNPSDQEFPVPVRDYPRIELLSGGILLTPKGPNQIEASMIFSLDPKTLIPVWILNWLMKTFSGYLYSSMANTATQIGISASDPYQSRIDSRPEFYQFLRDRLKNLNF